MDRIQRFFENLWERTKRWFRNPTRRNLTIGVILLLIASLMLGVPSPHVSLAAEPIFPNRFPWFTNALLTTLFVDLILIAMALAARAQLKEIPSGFGNFMEFIVKVASRLRNIVAVPRDHINGDRHDLHG